MQLGWWYFAIKLAAYSGWMALGLSWFSPSQRSLALQALFLGTLRLLMGLGFGILIWILGSLVYASTSELLVDSNLFLSVVTYLVVYIPVRWIEWAVFDVVLNRNARTVDGFLLGIAPRHRSWRLGGIAVSCLADIPVIISLGGNLPIGRFMC